MLSERGNIIVLFHLYEKSRVDKSSEKESNDCQGLGVGVERKEKWGVTAIIGRGFLLGEMNC